MTCSAAKFCSRSAMASLSSAKPSARSASGLLDVVYGPRPRVAESRNEERLLGRKGVVGRERVSGDLERGRVCVGRVVEGGSGGGGAAGHCWVVVGRLVGSLGENGGGLGSR